MSRIFVSHSRLDQRQAVAPGHCANELTLQVRASPLRRHRNPQREAAVRAQAAHAEHGLAPVLADADLDVVPRVIGGPLHPALATSRRHVAAAFARSDHRSPTSLFNAGQWREKDWDCCARVHNWSL